MKNLRNWMLGLALPSALLAGAVTVEKNGVTLSTYTLPAEGWLSTLSDNGDWALWQCPSNDETNAKVQVIDVRNGKWINYPEGAVEPGSVARMNDITNDGKRVFGSLNNAPGYYDLDKGTWEYLPLARQFSKWSGEADACTPDGKVVIGIVHQAWSVFTSVIWTWNDETQEYEVTTGNYPTREDAYKAGFMLRGDWEEYLGSQDTYANIRLMQISPDGKYAIGGLDHNRSWGNATFLYDIENQEWSWISYEENGKSYPARSAKMSNNGKWLLAFQYGFDMEEEEIDRGGRSFLKNMETGEITFPRVLGNVTHIDNDGNFYYSVGATASSPVSSLCVDHNGTLVDLHMILNQVYGIDFGGETGWSSTGFMSGISDNGLVIGANAIPRNEPYTLILPKSLYDVAGDVNVLATYQYAPFANSDLAHFQYFTVQLSNHADINTNLKASIKDDKGNVVAESIDIKPVNQTNSQFTIEFPETIFKAGEYYTVNVPEGLFYLENSSSKNPEITVTYVGREDGPVKVEGIDPADGSFVRDIDMTNPIVINFNTNIAKTTGVYAGLYIKGNDAPVTALDGVVDGKVLRLYSPTDYKLKKDTEYEIKVPAGMVTDIIGFCANEPFEFGFTGLYTSAGSTNPGVRFADSFDSPNESLNNWMQYEGDHNTPTSAMQDWGFDADNTPWNFSIREDEQNYNYAACSHSMYSPKGKSDDWMVTNQLLIDNKDIYLSFKAQSYRQTKADYLKVIVWPCDETFGSVNKQIIDRMREEGDVIFNERLSSGRTEQGLEGEWQEKKFQLDKYAGQSVYIAFVNENENQSAIFLDDILVAYQGKFVAEVTTPEVVLVKDDVEVSLAVTNQGEETVKKIKASYKNELTGSTDSYEADANIAPGATYEFTFAKKMKLESGADNPYVITLDVDGDSQSIPANVKNLKYEFKKKVLVEEITGSWCGNCPQGTLAFDYLESMFPGQVIPVAIHNNDTYAYPEYESFIGLSGYPSGKVNRADHIKAPMYNGQFATPERDQTWFDYVSRELENPAEAKLEIEKAYFCRENQKLEVKFNVEFAINRENVNYNVFTLVLEDELPGVQTNYFSNMTDPIYGDWGNGGKYGSEHVVVNYSHVARGIAGNSFYGQGNLIPRNVKVDEVIEQCIGLDRPRSLASADPEDNKNVSIACIIIDAATGAAITGDIIHTIGVEDLSDRNEISSDLANAEIILTVVGGKILANGNENGVEVYSLSGSRVANEGLNGIYIVRAADENGNIKTAKLAVR